MITNRRILAERWVREVIRSLSAAGRDADASGEILDLAGRDTEGEEFAPDESSVGSCRVNRAIRRSGPRDGACPAWHGWWCRDGVIAI